MTTLYLTEPYSTVRKDGESLIVKIPENKESGQAARSVRVPMMKVENHCLRVGIACPEDFCQMRMINPEMRKRNAP